MRNLKLFTLLLILLSSFSGIKTYSQSSTSIHFGPSFPLSDFGDDNSENDNAVGATTGVNIGLQYVYRFPATGFGLFTGIDFNYNGLKKEVKDEVAREIKASGVSNAEYEYCKFMSFPLTAGVNYTYQTDEKSAMFVNAGLAYNFLNITDFVLKIGTQKITQEYDLTNHLGIRLGAGLLISRKAYVSVDYYGLGKHEIKSRIIGPGITQHEDIEAKVDLMTLTFGLKF